MSRKRLQLSAAAPQLSLASSTPLLLCVLGLPVGVGSVPAPTPLK